MFHEYPKSLYLNADQESEHVIVQDAEQEAEQRSKGFRMIGEPQKENTAPKRTRKQKD